MFDNGNSIYSWKILPIQILFSSAINTKNTIKDIMLDTIPGICQHHSSTFRAPEGQPFTVCQLRCEGVSSQ